MPPPLQSLLSIEMKGVTDLWMILTGGASVSIKSPKSEKAQSGNNAGAHQEAQGFQLYAGFCGHPGLSHIGGHNGSFTLNCLHFYQQLQCYLEIQS